MGRTTPKPAESTNLPVLIYNNFFKKHKACCVRMYPVRSVSGTNSELAFMPHRVPQGSVLGPVLFSLFTNDLSDAVHSGETYLYADDTTIYYIAKSVDTTITNLNGVLDEITSWCDENRLIPHPEKCKAMLLHRRPFTGPIQELRIGNSSID